MISASSTSNIGICMIRMSLSAKRRRTLATEQAIIRHKPTSKCVPSRTATMALSKTIQMNRKRDSSSVQMQEGSRKVKHETICIVTGTIRIATVPTSSQVRSLWWKTMTVFIAWRP